ncbi:hypothetical protein EMCRGX_G034179 [Ephydatia muelleri]
MSIANDQLMFLLQIGCWARPAAFDFTFTSPLVPNGLPEASVTVGSAVFAAEERKHRSNDAKCAELGWVSISLAVETHSAELKEENSRIHLARVALQLTVRLVLQAGCTIGSRKVLSYDHSLKQLM